jgi:hypothetical protein
MSRRVVHGIVVVWIALMASAVSGCGREPGDSCAMCSKEITATSSVTLVSNEGRETRLCCAHCALLYAARVATDGSIITEMRARDYETGDPVDLADAFFVHGSETIPCCVPSVLVVASRETAVDLAGHGGGTVMDYATLRATLALEATETAGEASKRVVGQHSSGKTGL